MYWLCIILRLYWPMYKFNKSATASDTICALFTSVFKHFGCYIHCWSPKHLHFTALQIKMVKPVYFIRHYCMLMMPISDYCCYLKIGRAVIIVSVLHAMTVDTMSDLMLAMFLMEVAMCCRFLLIPFLLELRALMDWMFTDTTLSLISWLQMEDIFANVFCIRCSRRAEQVWCQ